jgi:sugar phosphate isomerase/epimerase
MPTTVSRRQFIRAATTLAAGTASWNLTAGERDDKPLFGISLAQWSLHRKISGIKPGDTPPWRMFDKLREDTDAHMRGDLDPLDFPAYAREQFGIGAVEYVNTFYFDKARDEAYLGNLDRRARDAGVKSLLFMCDGEGLLGAPDATQRSQSVENHHRWIDAAAFLGCHSIRVNAGSDPKLPAEEQKKLVVDGLSRLADYGDRQGINVLIENHGGLSSDASWLVGVLEAIDHPRVGTLPDFGNFKISTFRSYDPYEGVAKLMPFAKAVSAKSHHFEEIGGPELSLDYHRLMKIVLDAGYRGYVGIEFEGADNLTEDEGIRATQVLLESIRDELAP